MYSYEIEINNKETKELVENKVFSGNITFKQILSGNTFEEIKNNVSTCIFIYKPTAENISVESALEDMLNFLSKYKHEIDTVNISIYSKFQDKKYLIKTFNTISQLDLVFTSFNSEDIPLGYQLTIKE